MIPDYYDPRKVGELRSPSHPLSRFPWTASYARRVTMSDRSAPLRIVIVGGGFGGLYAATR